MFNREFYSLPELAVRWSCSIGDLLHLGIQNRAQICVNIYGMASGMHLTRMEETEERELDAAEIDATHEAWLPYMTHAMPHGIFELDAETLRFADMPDGLPLELHEASKFDGGWWNVEFDPPVMIRCDNLVILKEEIERLEREILQSSISSKTVAQPAENSLLGAIAALIAAWPGGKIPSGKELEKAAASVGVAISDDTIRKALKAARDLAKGFPA